MKMSVRKEMRRKLKGKCVVVVLLSFLASYYLNGLCRSKYHLNVTIHNHPLGLI
jgi:hypothetical protein